MKIPYNIPYKNGSKNNPKEGECEVPEASGGSRQGARDQLLCIVDRGRQWDCCKTAEYPYHETQQQKELFLRDVSQPPHKNGF